MNRRNYTHKGKEKKDIKGGSRIKQNTLNKILYEKQWVEQ